jgi:osmotically-inducible protein OsmY
MDRYDYDYDRQRRRNQGGSDRSFGSDRANRFRGDEEERYTRHESDSTDFDRYSRDRYGRPSDYDRGSPTYGNSNRFSSDYSSNERYNTGGSDRWEYRPQEDYRSLRDDYRFDNSNRHGHSSQRAYNEYDQRFDSNLGGRGMNSRRDWDYDRTSSYPGYGSNSQGIGSNQYGSNRHDSGQSFGTNSSSSSSYGSQRPGYSGSFGQNSGYGSSMGHGQEYGRNFSQGQGYNSNSSSSYGSHYGQGNYNQGQSRWGSESSFESKAGKGPKGYKRSDERIREEISDLLTSHHEVDPSEVEIKVSNCEVTLTGTVSSRHEKRLIEDLASQISGVSDVTNQLRVQQSHDSSRSSSDGQNKGGQSQGYTGQSSTGSQNQGSQQSSKSIQ